MDFEAFLAKKKIDLEQFKVQDVLMYQKLRSDFEQMGEKSFDHFYKYLFNSYRSKYKVKE
jgi:hypothetical protein